MHLGSGSNPQISRRQQSMRPGGQQSRSAPVLQLESADVQHHPCLYMAEKHRIHMLIPTAMHCSRLAPLVHPA